MAKKTKSVNDSHRKAINPEVREQQMIGYAVDLAEKQLLEGTASSQIVTHYLKLASMKTQLEIEIMKQQKELISAKTENLQSSKRNEELYEEAIAAMKKYSGVSYDEDY